ncbi:MAG: TraM recognition domain-containing protein [Clostridia bacterium]
MKYIDKLLKKLGTNRNTFVAYILTLVTIYLAVDRLVEMLFLIFTGTSVSYWGPIAYFFAIACPVFGFAFAAGSAYASSKNMKITLFYLYGTGFAIITISMLAQWVNEIMWLLFVSVPNYVGIVTEFPELVKPAFTSIAVLIPLATFYPVFKYFLSDVDNARDIKRSIWDFSGISLAPAPKEVGIYTCEVSLCKDKETGKVYKIAENRRYEPLLAIGPSGTGKTSLVFEPLMAKDLEKKFFYHETAKEMGYTALKTGIAVLNSPYDNDYLNSHFTLNMLTPATGKEKIYLSYMKKLIFATTGNRIIYRDLGITYLSPDNESTQNIRKVAQNYHIPVNIIDPQDSNSKGLNPFIYSDASQIAIAISSVLKGMYNTAHEDVDEAYREDITFQAIENVSILLKEMYPRLHGDDLPNLEDMLKMLTNFKLVEEMCEELQKNEELAKKYSIQISYFKKNFYEDGIGREDTERYVYSAITQLDNLLRFPGIKNILCNRNNNVDFDKALADGEITLICTRRGDLGPNAHKAFGLFAILVMQYSVLRRPGSEATRIPHFLYIDEIADFIGPAIEPLFTLYRKYHVGTSITAQNLNQLKGTHLNKNISQTILANCATEVVFGGCTPEEGEWWSKEMGQKRDWTFSNNYDTSKIKYDPKFGNVKWAWVPYFAAGKIQSNGFKVATCKVKDVKGKFVAVEGMLDFMESKHKEEHSLKHYNFEKYADGTTAEPEDNTAKKFNPKSIKFNGDNNVDPIQMNHTDSNYFFDNEDAIVVNFNKKKKN